MTNDTKWIKIGKLYFSEDLGEMDWDDATEKCKELGGRLPTRIELIDLVDNHKEDIKNWNKEYYFWSSTENYFNTAYAWYVNLYNGYTSNDTKTHKYTVRCVRSALEAKDKEIIKWAERMLEDKEISNGYFNAMHDLIKLLKENEI